MDAWAGSICVLGWQTASSYRWDRCSASLTDGLAGDHGQVRVAYGRQRGESYVREALIGAGW